MVIWKRAWLCSPSAKHVVLVVQVFSCLGQFQYNCDHPLIEQKHSIVVLSVLYDLEKQEGGAAALCYFLPLAMYFSKVKYLLGKPVVYGQSCSAFVRLVLWQFRCFKNLWWGIRNAIWSILTDWTQKKKKLQKLKTAQEKSSWLEYLMEL